MALQHAYLAGKFPGEFEAWRGGVIVEKQIAFSPLRMRVLAKQSLFSSTPPTSVDNPTSAASQNLLKLTSLKASVQQRHNSKINWDNACSYHVTNDPTLLEQMQSIPTDKFLGIGGSNAVTHVGYLPFLPSVNFMNVCYFAPDFPQTLLSLGQLQACGGAYVSHNNPNIVKIYAIALDPKSLIDTAPLIPGTNLLHTTTAKLNKSIIENISLSMIKVTTPPYDLSKISPGFRHRPPIPTTLLQLGLHHNKKKITQVQPAKKPSLICSEIT